MTWSTVDAQSINELVTLELWRFYMMLVLDKGKKRELQRKDSNQIFKDIFIRLTAYF